MALAGPAAGFILGGLIALAVRFASPAQPLVAFAVRQLLWVNVGWGLINLIPVLPLDGGHVLMGALGPKRQKAALIAGGVVGALTAAGAGFAGQIYIAVLFALLAARNFQLGLASPRAQEAAITADEALAKGWQALSRGEEEPARRLATLVAEHAGDPDVRNRARDLLAWCALARAERREALRQLEGSEPPESARALTWAMVLDSLDEPGRALPYALRAVELEPSETSGMLAVRLLLRDKQFERAAELARRIAWARPAARESALGEIAFAQNDYRAAAAHFESAFQASGHAGDAYNAGCSYARAGERTPATAWIKRALEAGFDDLEQLARDPDLAGVREDPEIARRLRSPRA
jgi:hypothetical protein